MTQLVSEYKSRRLFYRKYLYNVRVHTPLSYMFRNSKTSNKDFVQTKAELKSAESAYNITIERRKTLNQKSPAKNNDKLDVQINPNSFIHRNCTISLDDIKDAKYLLKVLSKLEDYHLRIEGNKISIFTNDETLHSKVFSKLRGKGHEYHKPDDEYKNFLTENVDVILVNKEPELEYKVTLNGKKTGVESLIKWLEANSDKSGVSPTVLRYLKERPWTDGHYFYIRDGKVLTLVTMLAGNCIRRVDKLVYAGNIDK